MLGAAGAGVLVAAQAGPAPHRDADAVHRQTALTWTGGSLLGLSGLVAGGALATAVFDPSTGTLRWNLFAGED
jgi:hypothetical protein